MDVNSVFFEIIVQSECFKKYINLRNEFILKENIYQKILISNNEETINYSLKNKKSIKNSADNNLKIITKPKENIKIGLNMNTKISQSRVYHEKFNEKGIKSPIKLGLNNIFKMLYIREIKKNLFPPLDYKKLEINSLL